MNSIHADGGWALALILSILFIALTIAALRTRWPRKPVMLLVGKTSAPAPAPPAKKPEKQGGHESHNSFSLLKLLGILCAIALGLIILWFIVPILAWIVNAILHVGLGDRIVQPSQVRTQTVLVSQAPPVPVLSECQQDAGTRTTVTLAFGDHPDWIRVPLGRCVAHYVVDGQKTVQGECSSNSQADKPSIDSSGETCKSSSTENWIRFMPPDCPCDGPITVHYWFEEYKP